MQKFFTVLMTIIGFLAISFISATPAQAGESPNITICHRVGPTHHIPERPAPPKNYTSITVSKTAIVNGKSEHVTDDPSDIIPPFDYGDPVQTFPGQSWTPENQAIYYNGCTKPNTIVSPAAPTFTQATCTIKNGLLTANDQPEGVELVQEPTLTNGVWSVVYKPAAGFVFPEGTSGTFTYEVIAPGPTDPLWDAEAGECRIANTGIGSISSTAVLGGGIALGVGMLALAATTLMKRREA